jgi:hypothetical protein
MAEHREPRVSRGARRAEENIEFVEDRSGFLGTGANGRCWRVVRAVAGWRLEFRDPGDEDATNAGIFGTKERAMGEANRYSARALNRG